MRIDPRPRLVLAIWLFGTITPANADWVVLRNGHKLRGEVLETTADAVVLRMPGNTATLALGEVDRVIKEPLASYFEQVARELLERNDDDGAARLLARGREHSPEHAPLAPLALAALALRRAAAAVLELDFDAAISATEAAAAAYPGSKRIERDLERLAATRAFFQQHGSLPGDPIALRAPGVTVLHHHPLRAPAWAERAAGLITKWHKLLRRSDSHSLPSDALLVLVVARTVDEVRAAAAKAAPAGILPDSDEALLISRTKAITHMGAVDDQLEALVSRYVATQLHEYHPHWIIEGLVAGGATPEREAEWRHQASVLLELEKGVLGLLPLSTVRGYAQLDDAVARENYRIQAAATLRFVCGFSSGRRTLSRAVEDARNAMLYDLLNPKIKHYRQKSYRIEDLIPRYLNILLPRALKFESHERFEHAFREWVRTGSRR
jgi:hypothetical protein